MRTTQSSSWSPLRAMRTAHAPLALSTARARPHRRRHAGVGPARGGGQEAPGRAGHRRRRGVRLRRQGMKHHLIPLWTVKDKYWWTQLFPAGRDLIVDHRYTPGTGGSVDSEIAFKQFRKTADTKQEVAQYCMDQEFIAAVDK